MLAEEPGHRSLQARFFGEAELTQDREILEEIGGIAQGEAQREPYRAWLRIAPGSGVGGAGRITVPEVRQLLWALVWQRPPAPTPVLRW